MPATASPDILETDVLVVGAGLAGLRAAIAAREAGARVVLISKGKIGKSGASAMTTAGYAAVLPEGVDDSIARHAADTFRGGAEVADPEMVEVLCAGAAEEVTFLESLGAVFEGDPVPGAANDAGDPQRVPHRHLSPSGDHSRSRVIVPPNHIGTDLTLPLAARVGALGVEGREFLMATALLQDGEGRVLGARCVALREDARPVEIRAGATILAAGGAGRLFPLTSNPNDVTGDAYALAARAGARLRDMEFIQFYPWRCIDPFDRARVAVQPSTFSLGGKLYNAEGERFMLTFNPEGAEAGTRDLCARGIFLEIQAGRGVACKGGQGVRLDLSDLDAETFARSNPKIARHCARVGIDHRTYSFVVTPEAHFWMGGLATDAVGATTLEGLWAAGEAAGGIHGANRLNSNALPDALVFGARAGAEAAAYAARHHPGAPAPAVPATGEPFADGELAARLRELQTLAWDALGIVRHGNRMAPALARAEEIAADVTARPVAPTTARAHHELGFLAETARLSLASALFRQESRGAHFREDFPKPSAQWRGTVMLDPGAPPHFIPAQGGLSDVA
ncbi:FAD-binding protein [Acuticoccus mangrovi]|uniref:L-aspartate oxidase n=1 Tax=Acuticoccus mangrovi TaxID=2796142 RepID=A0A934IKC9_9HYPH|nr:FAD-binding protein [Acuticoccus mangrovi]MBJ3776581.1 FAD-binding protein [Acuticoccus mangrovi]